MNDNIIYFIKYNNKKTITKCNCENFDLNKIIIVNKIHYKY